MPLKRSLEHCKGFAMQGNAKRLIIDQHQKSHIPQVSIPKLKTEKRGLGPSLSSGISTSPHAKGKMAEQLVSYSKKAVDPTKGRNIKELVMRPPKVVRNAIVIRVGPNGSSQPMYFRNHDKQDSYEPHQDSQPPKVLDDAEHRLLLEIIRNDDEEMEVGAHEIVGGRELSDNNFARGTNYKYTSPKLMESNNSFMLPTGRDDCSFSLSGVGEVGKQSADPAASETTCMPENLKSEIKSANRSSYHSLKVDKSIASGWNFGRVKSLNYGGKKSVVTVNNNRSDLSNIPHDVSQTDLCRDKVMKILHLFQDALKKYQLKQQMRTTAKVKGGIHLYMDATRDFLNQHPWIHIDKSIGPVPGVEIGDYFQSRAELVIIGLHSKFVPGIDFMEINGKLLATCIISSGRYGDKNESSDILTYLGEGGNSAYGSESGQKKLEDQKLVRGNLALMNSMVEKNRVRVIRSCQNMKASKILEDTMKKSKFVYDGLYIVSDCWKEQKCGKLVYKFQLHRIQGQPKLIKWDALIGSRRSNKASYGPIVVDDISQGKEKVPIRVVNAIDFEKPPPFKYITTMVYPNLHLGKQRAFSVGSPCNCTDFCSEDIHCLCIMKNKLEDSLKDGVSTAEKNPIVYECGRDCKCLPCCKNRVSQSGIKLQLEVFKTKSMKWGVRSRNFISAETFICEYVGELLLYQQKKGRIDFDESVSDSGNCYSDQVSQDSPNLHSSSLKDDDDTKNVKFGNVGRLIKHSCSPNLYAKCVLFDHEDKSRPHVMLFAAKNIPPQIELTFDYKLW